MLCWKFWPEQLGKRKKWEAPLFTDEQMRWFHIQKVLKLIKWIQPSCKVQDQHTKISLFLDNQHCTIQKGKKENYSFTIASKRIKYIGNNLTEEVKDLYTKIYKTEDLNIRKDTPCFWIGGCTIVKKINTTQRDLQIQCNSCQNSKGLILREQKTQSSNLYGIVKGFK